MSGEPPVPVQAWRGRCGPYWKDMLNVWNDRAAVCRYGHTSIFDLLGRDPIEQPLTPIELALFSHSTFEHVKAERRPLEDLGLPTTGMED